MKEEEEVGVGGEAGSGYNRPRRPNAETITYLRGLPLDVDAAKAEISAFLEEGEASTNDFPQNLGAALSAIDEIRSEVASLAGDELGSQCIETLAHIAAPYSETASRILLSACSGYYLHLATHRYGSHVIQSVLQLAVSSSSSGDLGLHDGAPQFESYVDTLPSLVELILGMVEELSDSATQLAVHVCGSHVLRTLLCVLGGVDLVSSGPHGDKKFETGVVLRGKTKSKKKKKKTGSDDSSLGASSHTGTMRVVYRANSRLDPNILMPQLRNLTNALLGDACEGPGELQQLACHPSAGPLLIVLLRVLTYTSVDARNSMGKPMTDSMDSSISYFRLGISRVEPTFKDGSIAHEMAKRLLCWVDGAEEQVHIGDVIYGYSGEPRGSHILETLLRLSFDDMHESIVKYGDFESTSSLIEYSEHEVSNFVVQTLLTTVRSKDQATRILKVLEKVISSGIAIDPKKRRRGILWRTCEMAAKYRVGQESLLKAIRMGFGSLSSHTNAGERDADGVDGKKKKQRKKAAAFEIKDCIPLLLDMKSVESSDDKPKIEAAGARAIYQMLHFSPRLCEDVLKGLLDGLSREQIEASARDGLGSRCILDGILDGPPNTASFAAAFKSLFAKLQGRWIALSTDRVGHHTVKKLFHALPKIEDKIKLVEELAGGGNRLNGNAMGRSISAECMVELYNENRKEWRKAMTMSQTKETLKSVDTFLSKQNPSNLNDDEKPKAKRKRKRNRSDKGDVDIPGGKKLATDAIIDALTFAK